MIPAAYVTIKVIKDKDVDVGSSSATMKVTEPVWFLLKTNTVFFFSHKSMMVRPQEATNQRILKFTCPDGSPVKLSSHPSPSVLG